MIRSLFVFVLCCLGIAANAASKYAVTSAAAPVGTGTFCSGATTSGTYSDVWSSCTGTNGSNAAVTYQWKLDATPIAGATGIFTVTAVSTGTVTLTSIPSGTLSALAAGTHSLTVNYSWTVGPTTGCSSPINSATYVITVTATPTVTITPSSGSRCSAGSATTINGSGATNYSWSPATGLSATTGATPSTSITTAGNTVYTVTGATGACTSTATYTISVTTTPTVTVSPSSGSRCSAAAATTINGSGATNYSWSPATGLSATTGATPTTSVATVGNTVYTVTGSNGTCTSVATYTIAVAATPTVTTTPSSGSRCSAGAATGLSASGATSYAWSPSSGLSATTGATPNTSITTPGNTVYTVTGTTGACTNTATYTISVTTTPTVTVTPSSGTRCSAAAATTINGAGATTYAWSPATGLSATTGATPTTSIAAAGTTVYTVIGSNGTCTSTATYSIAVTVSPTVVATPSSSAPCSGAGQSLAASGATTYLWSPASTLSASIGTPVTATPSVTTTYTLTGTTGSCSNTATATVTISALPYFESFENTSTDVPSNDAVPSCMAITTSGSFHEDTWTAATGTYNLEPEAGSGFASFGKSASNDYFYTRGFQLTSGNTYQFSFWYITDGNGGSTGNGEYNASIKFGTAQTAVAMSNSVTGTTLANFNNTVYQRWVGTFVAPSSGIYYVGINATNTTGSSSHYWSFDSLYLKNIPVCATPTSKATSVSCSGTTGTITTISFTAASPAVDSYLVVASTSATAPTAVNGTIYNIGTALGTGYVIGKGDGSSSITTMPNILAGSTTYHLYIYSFNAAGCTGGPAYYNTPATSSFATCMDPVVLTDTSTSSISLSWIASPGATSYTITGYSDPYLSVLVGSPHSVGTVTSYNFTGLVPSTTYYFTIAPSGSTCTSTSAPASGSTLATLPYYQGFENLSVEGSLGENGMQGNSQYGDGFSVYGGEDNGYGFYPINTGSWDYLFQGEYNGGYPYSWLMTPGMYLAPGTYTFSYYYNTDFGYGGSWPSLTAQISTNGTLPSNTSATMSGSPVTIGTLSSVSNTSWTQYINTVTISTGGIYYIGIGAASGGTSSYIAIDDIALCTQPAISSINGSPSAICEGADLALSSTTTGASGYTYSWTGPNSFTAATQSATVSSVSATPSVQVYTLVVSSDPVNTCSITATTTATVTALPAAITPSTGTMCTSSTFAFSGGGTGTWTSSNTSLASVNSSGVVTSTATAGGFAAPVTITYSNTCGSGVTATLYTENSMSGTYNVGVGQTFSTITAAVAAYNLSCTNLTGPVVFQLTDASYGSETFPITISFNSTASAAHTLTIKPASGVSPVISGSNSNAIFVLNNAQYVIIEGSNSPVADGVCPATASSQNLTINNTNAGTASAVVWLASGASNDTVRNCNITGSGIAATLAGVGSGGSAASISLSSTGSSNNNDAIVNNNISYVNTGIYSMGASAATKNTGTLISQNTMTTAGGLGAYGIFTGFENGITISGNSISGITNSSTDIAGINAGFASNGITYTATTGNDVINATITDNIIGSISQTSTYSASGITLAGTSSGTSLIANNEVGGVLSKSTGSDFTSGIFIGGVSGSTVEVWYNAADLTGSGGTGTCNTYALAVSGASSVIKVQDNLLVNTITNGTTNSAYAIGLAYSSYSNLTSNYNDLYTGPGTRTVGVGSLSAPSTTYTSVATWHTASAEDNNSLNSSPVFNSATDLRLSYDASNAAYNNMGTAVALTTDVNCATRSATPDMGVDEFGGATPPPVITYTVLGYTCSTGNISLSASITDASGPGLVTSGANVPQVYFRKNSGAWYHSAGTAGSGSTWNFTITAATMGGLSGGEVISYYIAAQDLNATPIVASYPVGVTATTVNSVTAAPAPNTYKLGISSGTFSIGVGQLFSTITAAVDSYNTNTCLSGALVYQLTASTYPGETFPITISNNTNASAANTLTIMPASGISPTITGSNSTAIFVLNNAKYVTIDGSNSPVTNSVCPATTSTRNMTITNTNTGTSSAIVWLATGASNNAIRNCILTGNAITTTLFGIGSGGSSGSISVTSTGSANNSNSFINNSISLVQHGIYTMGANAGSKNSGTIINQNVLTASNGIGATGILAGFENNITISGNSISNILNSTTSSDVVGINVGFPYNGIYLTTATGNDVTNATITNNKVDNISQGYSYSAAGIAIAGVSSGTTTVANNMISRVIANGVSGKFSAGLWIGGASGSTTNVYYNSLSLSGTMIGGMSPAFGIAISSNPGINLKNNIVANAANNGSGFAYAIGLNYSTYTNLNANNNDLYTSLSVLGCIGALDGTGTGLTALSDWQSATGKDLLSVSTAPVFTSTTDLDLTTSGSNIPMNNSGAVVSVTSDIDCNTRSGTTPDMGVNEFIPAGCTSAVAGNIAATTTAYCASGTPTVSLTGGSGYTTGYGATYQWRSSAASIGPWTNITGATNTTYSPTVSVTTYFQMKVGCTNTATSDTSATPVTVAISAQPSLGALTTSSVGLCSGNSLSLSSTAGGGCGTATYTWSGPALSTTTSGSSPFVFTPTVAATATGAYTLSLSYSGAGCTVTPTVTSSVVSVYPKPTVSVTPSVSTLCVGGSFTLSATPTGVGLGAPIYTWSGPAGVITTTSTSVSSPALSPALTPTASVVAGSFSVATTYTVAGCSAAATTTVTVNAHPSVTLSALPAVVCNSGTETLTATPSGGAGTATYTWSGPGITGTTSTGAVSTYSLVPGIGATGTYTVSVSYTGSGCTAATASSGTVTATAQRWTGSSSSDWNTAANWTCLTVPVTTDNVTIPVTTTQPILLSSATGNVNNLTVASAASVFLNSSSQLNVAGNFSNNGTVSGTGVIYLNGTSAQALSGNGIVNNMTLSNSAGATIGTSGDTVGINGTLLLNAGTLTTNGRLMLESNSGGNGRIGTITGGAITGNVVIQQYVPGSRRAYRFIAHPYSAAIPLSQIENYVDITGLGGSGNGFTTTTSNSPSAYWYNTAVGNSSAGNDPGWVSFTSTNGISGNAFNKNEGVRLFFRGAKGEGLTGASYTVDPVTYRTWGAVNTGAQTITLVKGSGANEDYNLVGNPYPSVTDIGTVINTALIGGLVTGGAFYVWDPYFGTSGQFVTETIGSAYYLGANESFEIRASANGNLLSFTESNKSTSVTDALMRSDSDDYLTLYIYDESYHPWDMLHIKFDDAATDNEDVKYDGAKPPSPATLNFYSLSADNTKLALDVRPFSNGNVVPLGITSSYAQAFIIKAQHLAVPDGANVYLHDKYLQTTTLLQQGAEYKFSITGDSASQGNKRFELRMDNAGAIAEQRAGLDLQLVPNPAANEVAVSYTNANKVMATVRIINAAGAVILTQDLGTQQKGSAVIALDGLASGVYMVELTSGADKKTVKLIKE